MDSNNYRPFTDITNSLNDTPLSPILSKEDIEFDIGDMHITHQRSPSRLGFNSAHDGDNSNCDLTRAEKNAEAEKQAKHQWTYSLFRRKGQDSSDSQEQAPLCVDLSFSSSSSSELGDDSEYSSDDSDEEEPAGTISFSGPTIQRPISSSRLPLANEAPARPPPAPFLSSLLAPLSPHHPSTQTLSASLQPLEINHHGLSKSALMHQKWFWSTRYHEWAMWEAQMEADVISEAYGGMAILPGTCPALNRDRYTSTRETLPPSPCLAPAPSPANLCIFPRLGDISALRDPYSVDIDRCFCHFPLWTVHKTLYMFDMHHRSTSLDDKMAKKAVDDLEFLSEDAIVDEQAGDRTLFAGSGDSDVTLVSGDMSGGSATKEECLGKEDDTNESDNDFRTWDGVRAWEISWYARWELLIKLVKRDEVKRKGLSCIATSSPEPMPKFFFAEANGEEEDDDDDDDEDYGTIISNPLYVSGRGSKEHTSSSRTNSCRANIDDLC